jgi:hypothetical protein
MMRPLSLLAVCCLLPTALTAAAVPPCPLSQSLPPPPQLSLLTMFLVNVDVNALVNSSMAVYPMLTIMLIKCGE